MKETFRTEELFLPETRQAVDELREAMEEPFLNLGGPLDLVLEAAGRVWKKAAALVKMLETEEYRLGGRVILSQRTLERRRRPVARKPRKPNGKAKRRTGR